MQIAVHQFHDNVEFRIVLIISPQVGERNYVRVNTKETHQPNFAKCMSRFPLISAVWFDSFNRNLFVTEKKKKEKVIDHITQKQLSPLLRLCVGGRNDDTIGTLSHNRRRLYVIREKECLATNILRLKRWLRTLHSRAKLSVSI
jgi:hypothetical protein